MVNAVSNGALTTPVTQSTTSAKPPVQSKQTSDKTGVSPDTVTLSKTAQALVTALQEARETPAQTSKEAQHGDRQAKKLLAKEEAAHPKP